MTVSSPTLENSLINAAGAGDREAVERLLAAGIDPSVQNDRGETALHAAVRGGHAEAAACLLLAGANHGLPDTSGRSPLSLDFTDVRTLHAVRQHYRRFRPGGRQPEGSPSAPVAAPCADLERDGFVRIPGFVQPAALRVMQHEFAAFVARLDERLARGDGLFKRYDEEEHWWAGDRAYVTNNAFKYSPQLVRFCCDPTLLAITRWYVGGQAQISRAVAMRYLPHQERTNDMFGWHHDMEEQRLKAMILLTDVGEQDQHMSYVLGSHRLWHPYEMFFKNECSLDYCREHLPRLDIASTIGNAGDVFLFDSNGAHRGVRRPQAAIRDAFFVEYTTERNRVWGGDIDVNLVGELRLRGATPFDWMLAVETKRWQRTIVRTAPSWIEDLPRTETWLEVPRHQE